MEREIYIILSKTGTWFSKFLNRFEDFPFIHSSISFDEKLDVMYSFGRKVVYFPIICGFVVEGKNKGTFKRFRATTCRVLKLSITQEQFVEANKIVEHFKKESRKYRYGFKNLAYMRKGKEYDLEKEFVCSQFCGYVILKSGIWDFKKDYSIVFPRDLAAIEGAKTIYEGLLKDYDINKIKADNTD